MQVRFVNEIKIDLNFIEIDPIFGKLYLNLIDDIIFLVKLNLN